MDASLLQSVLATLLCNIMQLKQQGEESVSSVKLVCSTQQIDAVTFLKISLEDDGPGLDSELWGRYAPQQSAVQFDSGNSGLGLYFSHLVAEHHCVEGVNGFLQLGESHTLGGASISLFIP